MTAADLEVADLTWLDDTLACDFRDCDDPATHQAHILRCGCVRLYCTTHTGALETIMGRFKSWSCPGCGAHMTGTLRHLLKVAPL